MSEPTQRQIKLIASISKTVGVRFTGTTKQEASVYIDEHLEDYRMLQEAGITKSKEGMRDEQKRCH